MRPEGCKVAFGIPDLKLMNQLLRLNLFALLLVAVFDPADQVTHLKIPLFVCLWIVFLVDLFFSDGTIPPIGGSLLVYIFLFALFLPLTSILSYFLQGGHAGPYDGFQYFKSFLFLALAALLVGKKADAIRLLSIVLTLLSIATIGMMILIYNDPGLISPLWLAGDASGTFAIGERAYADLSYSYVYFHTAPLLVLSVAYFTYQTVRSESRARYLNVTLVVVNLVAMLCSGTRNDIIFGLLIPPAVFLWYSGKNWRFTALAVVLVGAAIAGIYGGDVIRAMFDPENESNAIKLAHLRDYSVLFSNPRTLLFGQGLGSYFYSSAFGTETSITELTYLEFIRNFGLIIAMIYYGMLLYPIRKLRNGLFREIHYLILAYIAYLIICISNPLLVSSSGMLVLAIVLSKVFPAAESGFDMIRHAASSPPHPAS